jgi:ketosteroid isomerase-like protein
MAQDNVELVESAWEAFGRRDIEAATQIAGPNSEIIAPESLPWGGTYRGQDGFKEFTENLLGHFAEFSAKPEKVLGADDDHVVVVARVTAKTKGGNDFQGRVVWIYRLRDGKIVQAEATTDTAKLLEALG